MLEPNIEAGSLQKPPTPAEFAEVMSGVSKYNEQFGLGGLLGVSLKHAFGQIADEEGDVKDPSLKVSFEEEQSMTASVLDLQHADVIERLGLKLRSTQGGAFMFGPQGETRSGRVAIDIADKEKLLEFVSSLQPEDATQGEVQDGLIGMANNIVGQAASETALNKPSDAELDLITSLGDFYSQFARLGLGEDPSVVYLHELDHYAKQGCLREFVLIERYLADDKHFGPRVWHTDGAVDRWDGALHALDIVSANPKAKEVAERLRTHLIQSARGALEDLDNNKYPYLAPRADNELRPLFKNIIKKLS